MDMPWLLCTRLQMDFGDSDPAALGIIRIQQLAGDNSRVCKALYVRSFDKFLNNSPLVYGSILAYIFCFDNKKRLLRRTALFIT